MRTDKGERVKVRKAGSGMMVEGFSILMMIMVHMVTVKGQDAQWRGPNRDGVFTDTLLLQEWPEEGPEVLFSTFGLGKGFSSTVATEDMIYVTGTKDTVEYLMALALDEKLIWQKPYGPAWNQSFPEARCTPTVEDNRVYVLSGMDRMSCFNAMNGEVLWSYQYNFLDKNGDNTTILANTPIYRNSGKWVCIGWI